MMTMVDSGHKDHKIIAVATSDPEFSDYHTISEIPTHRLTMLRRFFQDYKALEGKAVEVDEILAPKDAYPVINNALNSTSCIKKEARLTVRFSPQQAGRSPRGWEFGGHTPDVAL